MFKKRKAFSLIEVLIVIAIVGIIATVSFVSLGATKKGADAKSACTQVASYINKARNYTLSGRNSIVTVHVLGTAITIIGSGNGTAVNETYALRSLVNCTPEYNATYTAPSGSGGTSAFIDCYDSTNSTFKRVTVTPYQAICDKAP